MKKLLLALSVMLLGSATAQAQNAGTLYISTLGGWSSHPALAISNIHKALDDGYNVGARIGYGLGRILPLTGFSLEADYFYNQSDYQTPALRSSGAQLGSSSFMGNLIYHIPSGLPVNLYGGAGIGAVIDNLDGTLRGSSVVSGWQAIGGVEYAVASKTTLFSEFRHQTAHDANIGKIRGVGNTSNNLSIGLKFAF